jgi:plasmid stabilization system protein ParE
VNRPIAFRRIAEAEFASAIEWYQSERPGLGLRFRAEVLATLDIIARHPDRFPIDEGDTREAKVDVFPYCVYYRVKPDRIVVTAVFHTSRDPDTRKGRN